jgi:radical SAM protein with 4Fe4S-binding SPASM domain
MLGVTRLLCGTATPGDALRYERRAGRLPPHLLHYSEDKRPVVVWNLTRHCNLFCAHCYTDSHDKDYAGELSTEEALGVIDDLARFGVPVILFSGGEPLLRPDLLQLIRHAQSQGIRAVISTNGTLITPALTREMKELGLSYVGVSIDGPEHVHDKFRGRPGAFQASLRGIRACLNADLRVGIRVTLTRYNYPYLDELFDLIEEENIPRACFYHLAYAGRGDRLQTMHRVDLTHEETRDAVDTVFRRTMDLHRRGITKDVLTVDNHTDAVYLYLKVRREQPERAEEVYQMLRWQGGNQSGVAVADIDNLGNVHADQFSWHYSFGNVRERPFSQIWTDTSDAVMRVLKDRRGHIKGKCSVCPYFEICNGNLRARAESYYGDPWAEDPACYLSDEELGITEAYERLEPLPSKAPSRGPSMPATTVEVADVAPAPRE